MKFKVTLELVVKARTAADAVELGVGMCEHLMDTFNDNFTLTELCGVEAEPVKDDPAC